MRPLLAVENTRSQHELFDHVNLYMGAAHSISRFCIFQYFLFCFSFEADCYDHLAVRVALKRTCQWVALILVTAPDVADAVRPDLAASSLFVDERVVVGNFVAQTRIRRRIDV